MANIKVIGDAMVVTSAIKMEDIKLLQRLDADSLVARDKNDEPVYAVFTGDSGFMGGTGIRFTGADNNGFATVTILLPPATQAQREEFIKENYAMAITALQTMEELLAEYLVDFKAKYNEAMQAVKFIDSETEENIG